uniref:Uncharacterized protein n=1 Tax=Anguilla anguilla TaxID=7936 RepID=A0A0E9XAB3_ANGAN
MPRDTTLPQPCKMMQRLK